MSESEANNDQAALWEYPEPINLAPVLPGKPTPLIVVWTPANMRQSQYNEVQQPFSMLGINFAIFLG
jgi:hypothetical protein